MFIGPVFSREVVTGPRRAKYYVWRAAYGTALFVLTCTAYMVFLGNRDGLHLGEMARFGSLLFQILAPLQLAVVLFFSAILAAGAVAQEKDKKTLILLLLTRMTNSELVMGKLLASLLTVVVMLAAGLPIFLLASLFGGVSFDQIARAFAVTGASALAAASLGSMLALWREKTFQTLAATCLVLVIWLVGWELVQLGLFGAEWFGIPCETLAATFSPWRALLAAMSPPNPSATGFDWRTEPALLYVAAAVGLAAAMNGIAMWRVRVWNPGREGRTAPGEEEGDRGTGGHGDTGTRGHGEAGESPHPPFPLSPLPASKRGRPKLEPVRKPKTRQVWDNPIIWREMCTQAYGKRTLAIKLVYVLLFGLSIVAVARMSESGIAIGPIEAAMVLVPLAVLSLVLVNAQAVTALTSERDAHALDLLLVTDITPREFVFGKLGGILYNTKEMVLLPMALCVYLWYQRAVGGENLIYLLVGLGVMNVFVAMLGIHVGMAYANSRTAIATSLGTVFFLFVGVAVCMRIMVAFSGSFQVQLAPFVALLLGGGIGLFVALGVRNPSSAIFWASFGCPAATFYAITSFLVGMPLAVFSVIAFTYGFTTLAMLVPAIYGFDVATGRTVGGDD